MLQIQSILDIPGYKTTYYMKNGDQKAKRISQDKWFELYDMDKSKREVLPPLTRTDKDYEDKLEKISKVIQNF